MWCGPRGQEIGIVRMGESSRVSIHCHVSAAGQLFLTSRPGFTMDLNHATLKQRARVTTRWKDDDAR